MWLCGCYVITDTLTAILITPCQVKVNKDMIICHVITLSCYGHNGIILSFIYLAYLNLLYLMLKVNLCKTRLKTPCFSLV